MSKLARLSGDLIHSSWMPLSVASFFADQLIHPDALLRRPHVAFRLGQEVLGDVRCIERSEDLGPGSRAFRQN